MSPPSLRDFAAISLDCYGTLVDWESGIYHALRPLYSSLDSGHPLKDDRHGILQRYCFHESQTQARSPTLPYSGILAQTYEELAKEWHLIDQISEEEKTTFANSIADWPVFDDTVANLQRLKKHFKLVILSNVDRASFTKTLAGPLGAILFDAIYIAEEIGSYKPDLRNFHYLIEHCEEELRVRRERILHTAYALVHDLAPANEVGLATCWVERRPNAMGGELKDDMKLDFRFRTLAEMADAIETESGKQQE
jgi:2-haloalkanoic acid dehalogenase type II